MKKRGLNHLMSKIAGFIIKKKLCLAWPTRMVLCKKMHVLRLALLPILAMAQNL